MKSDREFLRGIYEKAELLKEENKHQSINFKHIAAALVIIAIIPLSLRMLDNPKVTIARAGRSAIEDGLGTMEIYTSEESAQENSKEGKVITEANIDPFIEKLIEESPFIVTGRITSTYNDLFNVEILDVIKGDLQGDMLTIVKEEEPEPEDDIEVLLFLKKDETSAYRLTENIIFSLYTITDKGKVYLSSEGLKLYEKEIKEIIYGGTVK